jgi:hypothetical protein
MAKRKTKPDPLFKVVRSELCDCPFPVPIDDECGKCHRKLRPRNPPIDDGGLPRAAATLVVTEQQIDHMFTSWPLEDKVMCIQLWLDRLDGR